MSARCRICNTEFVEKEGDVCVSCMLGGCAPNVPNTSFDSNIGSPSDTTAIPKKSKPSAFGTARIKGTVQNFMQEPDTRGALTKWSDAFFSGTPYSSTDKKYIFDLKDDNVRNLDFGAQTGSSVVICGEIAFGSINNNNVVEVYGDKNKHNIIAAKKIRNISNGSVINITKQLSAAAVRTITLLVVALLAIFICSAAILINDSSSSPVNDPGTSSVSDDTSASSTDANTSNIDSTDAAASANDSQSSSLTAKDITGKIGVVIVGVLLIVGGLKFGRNFSKKTMFIILGLGIACILMVFSPKLFSSIIALVIMFFILKFAFKNLFSAISR